MKRSLIKRLIKEGKLKKVESSLDVSNSYSKKSNSSHLAGKLLLKNKFYEESLSNFYYSMYNSLLSLLFRVGVKSENHSFSIFLLNSLFDRYDLYKDILFAKKERIDKQYYVDFIFEKEDVEDLMKISEKFNLEIKLILDSLNFEKVKFIGKKIGELFK